MSEEMINEAVEVAAEAIDRFGGEYKDIAAYVKKTFDKKYEQSWQCVCGKDFGRRLFEQDLCRKGKQAAEKVTNSAVHGKLLSLLSRLTTIRQPTPQIRQGKDRCGFWLIQCGDKSTEKIDSGVTI
ncbi:dynein light chain 1 cytoplasmic [Clonorchis sinensis]|uniref:Dynein light chain n=1 Tax=Clonorchis sinensis TaxID=79923 RepID=G7YW14_CLOSI|nr:dynein light chain 1 cytoplasmic [Clonorchis sinensis]